MKPLPDQLPLLELSFLHYKLGMVSAGWDSGSES